MEENNFLNSKGNIIFVSKKILGDFPGDPVVKNPPSHTGDAGLIPGQVTKILHASGQLNLRTTAKKKPSCHNCEPEHCKKKASELPLRLGTATT